MMDENSFRRQIAESLIKAAPDIDQNTLDPEINFRDQFEVDSVDFLNIVLDLAKPLGILCPLLRLRLREIGKVGVLPTPSHGQSPGLST